MSKAAAAKDCDIFTRKRGPQTPRTNTAATEQDNVTLAANNMANLTAVLSELKSLHAEFGGFGSKLDSIDDRLGKMASSIATLETNLSEVKQNVSSNTKRTEEAENRIAAAEELTEKNQTELTKAMKKIASLESKAEDLENRSRRKNLRLFGLREGAEGSRPLLEFMQEMLPRWLGSDTGRSFILERVHRTLAPPKPNQDRAVLIRFLQFQDREFVFRSTKQRIITYDGSRLFFAQDLSTETIRQRRAFDAARKVFAERGTFRGFQYNPCKMRIVHNGRIHLFTSPKEAEDFHREHGLEV